MDTHDEWISQEQFSDFLSLMPQVCVELVVTHDGGVLLAKRTIDPAKGEWFWPGGRLYKGETFEAAVHRLAEQELGLDVEIDELLGVKAHFWETDTHADVESRHTVNIIYSVRPAGALDVTLDEQHSAYRFFSDVGPEHHEYVRTYVEDFDLLS